MTINSDLLSTGRRIRSIWRDEEESFLEESSHYSRKQITLLEYLSSVAHSGHNICVHSRSYETLGTLIHLGTDFFSIVSDADSTQVHSYSVSGFSSSVLEIDVLEKVNKSWRTSLFRQEKSFRSLIDDLSTQQAEVEIETNQGNVYTGEIQMFADSICIAPIKSDSLNEKQNQTLINEGSTIISLDAIVGVLYSI